MQNDNVKYIFLQKISIVLFGKKCHNANTEGQLTLNFLALTVGLSLKSFIMDPPTIWCESHSYGMQFVLVWIGGVSYLFTSCEYVAL
jgi:hypothetical protein